MTVVFLTNASTSPWTRPADWTDAGHTLNLVGAGGIGGVAATGTSYRSGGGGGGGAHALLTYTSGALASTTAFFIGINIPTNVFLDGATKWGISTGTGVTNSYYAQCGGGSVATTAGTGGTATTTVNGTPTTPVYSQTQKNNGGSGGATGAVLGSSGGGGGAGGPAGVGGNGGPCITASRGGGGGGSGNNGGSAAATSASASGTAGAGAGGGVGGTSGTPAGGNATAATGDGGGGGFFSGVGAANTRGGNAADDDIWAQTTPSTTSGPGGGGGGGGANSVNTTGPTTSGGNGANYGGGGGGAGGTRTNTSTRTQGTGASGLIVITYTGATADAWSVADKTATLTLSNGDKTGTVSTASAAGVRSTTTRQNGPTGTGKYYAEFVLDATGSGALGIKNLSSGVNSSIGATYVFSTTGNIVVNGNASGFSFGVLAAGDVIGIAWNAGSELVWFRKNGGLWNNNAAADPAAGTNGIDPAITDSVNAALWFYGTTTGFSVSLRTKAADLTYQGPSGFTSWMNEVILIADAWNVNDKSANITLSNNDKTATATSATAAGVRSVTKRLNGAAGKYYVELLLINSAALRFGIQDLTGQIDAAAIAAGKSAHVIAGTGIISILGTGVGNFGPAAANGDVICMAWDAGAKQIWFRKNNGLWNNDAAANPATNTNGKDCSGTASVDHAVWMYSAASGVSGTIRTKAADLTLSAPSGFVSWMGEALAPPAVYNQKHFRWRRDSGAVDATPAWNVAEDSSPVLTAGGAVRRRVRFVVDNTGSSGTIKWQLYYSKNGGAYTQITNITEVRLGVTDVSTDVDGTAIAVQRLTAGSGTWQNGMYVESNPTADFTLAGGAYTEIEFGLYIDATLGSFYDLQLYASGAPINSYDVTPRFYVMPWSELESNLSRDEPSQAYTFTETGYLGQHYIWAPNISVTTGVEYQFYVEYKSVGPNPRGLLMLMNAGGLLSIVGNPNGTEGAYSTSNWTPTLDTVTDIGSGWYALKLRGISPTTSSTGQLQLVLFTTTSSYQGLDNGSGVQFRNFSATTRYELTAAKGSYLIDGGSVGVPIFTPWTEFNSFLSGNQIAENGVAGVPHYVRRDVNFIAGDQYQYSIEYLPSGPNPRGLSIQASIAGAGLIVTGSNTGVEAAFSNSANWTMDSHSVISVGGGYYKLLMKGTRLSTTGNGYFGVYLYSTSTTYNGLDNGSGVFFQNYKQLHFSRFDAAKGTYGITGNAATLSRTVVPKVLIASSGSYAFGQSLSLGSLLSCTRASTGYAQTSAGTLTSFAANQLRITDLGLLVEDTRTNICKHSQQLTGASWDYISSVTVSDNVIAAPDGTSTAGKISETNNNDEHALYNSIVGASTGLYTCSVYMKAGERNFGCLSIGTDTDAIGIVANLTTGAVTIETAGGSPTNVSYSCQLLGNGWCRLIVTRDCPAGSIYFVCAVSNSATPSVWSGSALPSYLGTTGSGIYVWGAQCELGAFASSYIPTTSASATRAADVVTAAAGNALGSAIRGASGSVVGFVGKSIGGPAQHISFMRFPGAAYLYVIDTASVGFFDDTAGGGITKGGLDLTGGNFKIGAAWDSSGRSVAAKGNSDTSATALTPANSSDVSMFSGGGVPGWTYVNRITVWGIRLSDTALQNLTNPVDAAPTGYTVDLDFGKTRYLSSSTATLVFAVNPNKVLPAASGTYVISGKAATLQFGHRLIAAKGAYAVAGQAATLRFGHKVIAAQGAYAVAGKAATLRYGRVLTAAIGAYVYSGKATDIDFGHRLIAAQGAYAVAGNVATFYAIHLPLTAAQGAYVYSGNVTTFSRTMPAAAPPAYASQGTFLGYGGRSEGVLAAPTGITNGDLLIAYYFMGDNPAPPAPTPPAGWSALPGSPTAVVDGGGFNGRYHIFYKFASGESGDYTFINNRACSCCGVIIRYTGVDPTTPFHLAATTNIGTGTTITATGFTTIGDNTLVIFTEHDWGDNANDCVPPTGTTPTFTERVDQVLIYIADGPMTTKGATGDESHASNSVGANPWAAYLIALNPVTVASPTFVLMVDKGAYTVSGNAATLRYTRVLAAARGSYAIAGNATTLRYTRIALAAARGSYAIAGNAATLRETHIPLIAAQGSYAVSGKAATLRYTRIPLVAAQGVYSLSGKAATLTEIRIPLVAAQGAYSLSGKAATLQYIRTSLIAAQGAYALTGNAVTLRFGPKFAAAQGTYATAGKVATLQFGHRIISVQGAYATSGKAATLTAIRKLSLAQGAYAIAGTVPILRYQTVANVADPMVFAITGSPAKLTQTHRPFIAAQGAYNVTGRPAVRGYGLSLAKGSYAVAGKATILQIGRIPLAAASGVYATTGRLNTLLWTHKLVAAQGVYAVAGKDVALRYTSSTNALVSIPYGITGFSATITQTHRPLIAAQGSYSVTGRPAVRSYGLSLAQGSYAISGKIATLRYGRIALAAAKGAYASTGRAATLAQDHRLIATQGAYSVTGRPASILHAYTLLLAKGSYAITGPATPRIILVATQGAYSVTGRPANLSHAYFLSLAKGSYAITGQLTFRIRVYGLSLAQGVYATSGKVATFKARRSLASAQGSYAVLGNLADLRKIGSYSIDVQYGSFAITGNAVTFLRTIKMLANRGSYTSTGNAAGLKRGLKLSGTEGSYISNGQNAILRNNRRLIAVTNVYSSIGNDSTKIHEHNLIALSRAYTVTGQLAGSKRRYQGAVASGVYAISGHEVDLISIRHGKLDSRGGRFTLSGKPVTFLLTNSRSDFYGMVGSPVTFIRTYHKYGATIQGDHATAPTLIPQSKVHVDRPETEHFSTVKPVNPGKVSAGKPINTHSISAKKVFS